MFSYLWHDSGWYLLMSQTSASSLPARWRRRLTSSFRAVISRLKKISFVSPQVSLPTCDTERWMVGGGGNKRHNSSRTGESTHAFSARANVSDARAGRGASPAAGAAGCTRLWGLPSSWTTGAKLFWRVGADTRGWRNELRGKGSCSQLFGALPDRQRDALFFVDAKRSQFVPRALLRRGLVLHLFELPRIPNKKRNHEWNLRKVALFA